MDTLDKNELSRLIIESLEGVITSERMSRLDKLLLQNPEVMEYYIRHLRIYSLMTGRETILFEHNEINEADIHNLEIWKVLAEHEKTAPEIEIPEEKPQRELIQKVVYPQREKRKVSKFSIVFLAMNAAAILFLVFFLKFASPKYGVEVATLTDSINAKWANVNGSMEKGTRLITRSENMFLQKGLAELSFDDNAKVVIEGPAEFELLSDDRIDLRYGRVYATVPHEAIGFTVSTPTSRIIDLGTEFGVQADAFGDVQLHVIKGKTTLIAGDKSNKFNLEVREGQAKKVSGSTQTVTDIPCVTKLFVRDINSDSDFIWKGQTKLDLANIVAGGSGFHGGRISNGIDPATGDVHSERIQQSARIGQDGYKTVPKHRFIDGVFVPNGVSGANVISSAGHTFLFPKTDGEYYSDITSDSYVLRENTTNDIYPLSLILAGTQMSTEPALIFMHPNAGITFELDEIRQCLPNLKIDQLTAFSGVSKSGEEINQSEFWILIDGICVFHHMFDKNNSGIKEINIPITPEQKFLTLATTDGGDGITMDWCVFADPQLELKPLQGGHSPQ